MQARGSEGAGLIACIINKRRYVYSHLSGQSFVLFKFTRFWVKLSEIEWNLMKSNEFEWNWVKLNEIEWPWVNTNKFEWKLDELEWNWMNLNEIEWNWMKVDWTVEQNRTRLNEIQRNWANFTQFIHFHSMLLNSSLNFFQTYSSSLKIESSRVKQMNGQANLYTHNDLYEDIAWIVFDSAWIRSIGPGDAVYNRCASRRPNLSSLERRFATSSLDLNRLRGLHQLALRVDCGFISSWARYV